MRIALTFDDGPGPWTEPILDLLAEHKARATFFVCGHAIKDRADEINRMVDEGHEIGVHTWSHPHMSHLSDNDARTELRGTIAMLLTFGVEPTLWRAPYFDLTPRIEGLAAAEGLRHVLCDIDPSDWACDDPEVIYYRATQTDDDAIVDLHDGIPPDGGNGTDTRQPTVDAVRLILERHPDIEFVTVSELWA